MAASTKYFITRVLSAVVTLALVMLLMSTIFFAQSEAQLESRIQNQVTAEIQNNPELSQMSDEELSRWREERISSLRSSYGLDKSMGERIINNTFDSLTLNFGRSYQMRAGGSNDVVDIIMSRLPRTILLFSSAAVVYILLGLMIGLKAAQVAGGKLDKFLSIFGISSSSMPMWWVGMLAILLFSYRLGLFPSSGLPFPQTTGLDYYLGVLHRMVLPLGTIVFTLFGARAWATRNIVTDVLQDDYIMAARAKGVPERKVIYGHTLRTAAPPVVTSALLTLLMSVGGAMITEVIFNWPGMGRLLFTAIQMNDVPVITGIVFVTSFMYIFGYLIADLLYGLLDPRVEMGSRGGR
ncbi:MAG: ABC transporter permease [Candidatus Hadarchaeota archaeon]